MGGCRAVHAAFICLKNIVIILIAAFCFFWSSSTCGAVLLASLIKVYILIILLSLCSSAPLRVRAFRFFLPPVNLYRGRVFAFLAALSLGASSLYMARVCQQRRRQAMCRQSVISGLDAESQQKKK